MDVPLKPSKYYHIYNHANGFENIFISDENYRFFLVKFNLYISHIADTLAYCLMPNHFHLLIKIKNEEELSGVLSGKNPQGLTEPKPLQNLEGLGVIYNKLISLFNNELNILMNVDEKDLLKAADEKLVNIIIKNRRNELNLKPGYDGVYGKIVLSDKPEVFKGILTNIISKLHFLLISFL